MLQIHKMLGRSRRTGLVAHFYIGFVSLVLFAKYFFGYVRLSANIVAMFPILAEEGPELLTPSILAQAVDNILFSSLDIIIGCVTVRYFMPCKFTIFMIFLTKNFIQISIGIAILNIYRDFYNNLKYHIVDTDTNTLLEKTDKEKELFVRKESLV
ncbi:uncharacterized protein [Eurosta solidaginis]|uniref:uncharacterized protein isoform X2 n=1 Tax=Eurosta solidaginis TaxID=178769 RepID=UPI003531628B